MFPFNHFCQAEIPFQAGILPPPCKYRTCLVLIQQDLEGKGNLKIEKPIFYFLLSCFCCLHLKQVYIWAAERVVYALHSFPQRMIFQLKKKRSYFILYNVYQILRQAVLIMGHSVYLGCFRGQTPLGQFNLFILLNLPLSFQLQQEHNKLN